MTSIHELSVFSDALADAVQEAGKFTVLVSARRRLPATGIVYAPNLVLTADHVIEREEGLRVGLTDGKSMDASIAGRDPARDIALLRLEKDAEVSPAQPDDQPVRVGQLALALGRTQAESIQASLGIVSALEGPARTGRHGLLEQYIRTDTVPFPGFSGGPLVSARGRLLGMNTSGLSMGHLITIPSAVIWAAAAALAEHGHIRRGYLGVRSQPAALTAAQQQSLNRSQETGLLLATIEDGSPAAESGLIIGDILIGLAGQPVQDYEDLQTLLGSAVIGQRVEVEILRGGQPLKVSVAVRERSG